MSRDDNDIIDSLMNGFFSLLGWIFTGLINLVASLIKGIFSLASGKSDDDDDDDD